MKNYITMFFIRRALSALLARLEARMKAEPDRRLSHMIDAVLLLLDEQPKESGI
jgi:hypothetical protein